MARVTSNSSLQVKLIRIEGEHHLDHATGGLLRLFVVLIEGIANVAELALDPNDADMNCIAGIS